MTASDRKRFREARERGKAHVQDASAVIDASYDRNADAVRLIFRGGGTMSIPRGAVPGLERRSEAARQSITVSPAGDALSWPQLDIDIHVPGLVERAFGTRLFAAATGHRGGRKRTKAKAAAARRNGAKGGRPRKRVAA